MVSDLFLTGWNNFFPIYIVFNNVDSKSWTALLFSDTWVIFLGLFGNIIYVFGENDFLNWLICSSVLCVTIEYNIIMKQVDGISNFFDLVLETSSACLMDGSNWNHNDKKGLFLFSERQLWSMAACRQRNELCSGILDTRWQLWLNFHRINLTFIVFQTLLWLKKQLWTEHGFNLQRCAAP